MHVLLIVSARRGVNDCYCDTAVLKPFLPLSPSQSSQSVTTISSLFLSISGRLADQVAYYIIEIIPPGPVIFNDRCSLPHHSVFISGCLINIIISRILDF